MHLTLDVFTPDEAQAFLTRAAPDVAVGPQTDAPARIARRCGYLPLALGLVTGQMRVKSGWTLTDHADRLDERHQARHLDTGLEIALELSYQHLPEDERRLLRRLALHPGQDLDGYAAAALAGDDLTVTRERLDHLHRHHLLSSGGPGRYAFHDLVRLYATGRAGDEDTSSERRAALTRLFDYYLAAAAAAMDTLRPAEAHRRPRIPAPATPLPPLAEPEAARTWLDTERTTLVAVAGHTAADGWPEHAVRLSGTVFRYLSDGYHDDALAVHGHAYAAARRADDPVGQAQALTNLGATHVQRGQYEAAADHLGRALDRYQQIGDVAGQARVLTNLGVIRERIGRFRAAADHYARAVALHRQIGDPTGEARALGNAGIIEARLGHLDIAANHLRQALARSRQVGDRAGEASHLNNLGDIEGRLGRTRPAGAHLRQALALFRQLANRAGEAGTLDSLGSLQLRLGRPDRAAEHYRQALAIVREMGEPQGEAYARNGLGEAATAAGRPADAVIAHDAAYAVAVDIGDRFQQARAQAGLGHAHLALGDLDRAREYYRRAVDRYTDLDMPQADDLRAHLTLHG